MIDQLTSRAELLLNQRRYNEAGDLLVNILKEDPANPRVLSLLAEVKLQLDKNDEALDLISQAIALAPDVAYLFYMKARIHLNKDEYDEAEDNLETATNLDPEDADYFALHASVKLDRKQFEAALELADKALELDAENILALNTRSSALLKLDRKEEAYQTIEGALREDPNNAYTHASYGWNLLEKNEHVKALEHFKEALKINPNFSYAQSGMIEALKAKNFFYRWFLKYSFWMSNLTEKYQWGVIAGFYILSRLVRGLASVSETMRPYLIPVIILLTLVALSTWIITPISNLFLRLNKYGKHLLGREEKISSNFVGISALIFITGVIIYFITTDINWLVVGGFGLGMMLPLGSLFMETKIKNAMIYYNIGMLILGFMGIFTSFNTGEQFNVFTTFFGFGFIGFQWIANFMSIKASNK